MKKQPESLVSVNIGVRSTRELFELFVLPTVEEFNTKSSLRALLNACYALWSMADWSYYDYLDKNPNSKVSPSEYRQMVTKDLIDMALVRDIAEAGKHRRLGRKAVRVEYASEMSYGGTLMPLASAPSIATWTECNVFYDDGNGNMTQRSAKQMLAAVSSYWHTKIDDPES